MKVARNTIMYALGILPRHSSQMRRIAVIAFGFALTALWAVCAKAAGPASFATPEAGAQALAQAVKANDMAALETIFGTGHDNLLYSGDPVADAHNRKLFATAYDEMHTLVQNKDASETLVVGKDQWPMPIPLVKQGDGWIFDTQAGEDEIIRRRIGRDERAAMRVCLAIVDAEHQYATQHLDHDGVPVYTSRFASTSGKRDGLYWPTSASEPPSPLGALLAKAAVEGYGHSGPSQLTPYHGYYYRILTQQGKAASGGERDYIVRGKMIGGFAVLAYPARYGTSGVMSFMVDRKGTIYAKDLGAGTGADPTSIAAFNPDASWRRDNP
jgi:DUF2950 family protein